MRTRPATGGLIVAVALVLVAAVLFIPRGDTIGGTATPASTSGDGPVDGADGVGDPYFPLAGNGGYDVAGYDIVVDYDPATDELTGTTTITATATENLRSFHLDLRLAASAVTVDGAPAELTQDDGELQVVPATSVDADQDFTVVVEYGGVPSEIDGGAEAVEAWARTADGAVAVGQPDIAAWWYPSNDHPSDKATVAVTATVPGGVEVISNGALLGGPEPVGDGRDRWRWRADEPMATYLAFVAIGQYDIVSYDTEFGPYLAAYSTALSPTVAADARAAVEQTPAITRFLADIVGPYPFSQLGAVVPADPSLGFALENQTRPVYSEAFFTDGPETGVVVHELAHQWFGDSVAVADWSHIWLNEGFATYFEWFYTERTGGTSAAEVARTQYERIPDGADFWTVAPGDPGAENVLDGAVYLRGALALQALRTEVGDEAFVAILRAWATEKAGGNGTTEEFVAVAERVADRELDELADEWLYATTRPADPPA